MRTRFDKQLFELNRETIEMGAMCEEAIAKSAKALSTGDIKLANEVKTNSVAIDQMERDIESLCMKLLLHQQPVAHDLRIISAALKMITDLERIGDQAEDIAEIVISLDGYTLEDDGVIEKMSKTTMQMVSFAVDAFVKKDVEIAQKVIGQDDEVDAYFKQVKRNIIEQIATDHSDGEVALDLMMGTDAKLRKALKEQMHDKIKVIVAQRVSTVMDADMILVLDEGKVVGKGTHDELLANNTTYQEIVHSQLREEDLA